MTIRYTEDQKRKALIAIIRNAAQEARIPQPVRNSEGDLINDVFAGPEFDVLSPDHYWKTALVKALTETDALFVLERMTVEDHREH